MVDVKKLPLDIKIGQMIMAGFPSKYYDGNIEELIEAEKIGNFILFADNMGNKNEVMELTRSIQKKLEECIGISGIISTDQEGGMVTRVREGVTVFSSNMAFAAANEYKSTFKEGKIVGEELRSLGINMNIAPVMDVNCNPKNPVIGCRSYGDDPESVSKLGIELIKGLKEKGVIAVAKHFPGHGDTSMDSHLSLPVVNHDIKRLQEVELLPFKNAIAEGVDAIMSAHVLFPKVEPDKVPATLSNKVLTGLLKNKMGFKGLIVTDCMEMKAIADFYGSDKAAVKAIIAGADLICISHSKEVQKKCVKAIKAAVLNGQISEERIDQSVKKILQIKGKYNIDCNLERNSSSKDNKAFAEKISSKSITILKDNRNLIPIKGKVVSISTRAVALTGAEDKIKTENSFCHRLNSVCKGHEFEIPMNPGDDLIKGILEKCSEADRIVIGIYNASVNKNQIKLVEEISKVNPNIILVSLRNPYDILSFKEISTYVNAYEYTELSIKSTIKVLKGEIKAEGISPVKICM